MATGSNSGQVDVIVTQKAIDDINRATTQLNILLKKIIQVNKTAIKGKGGVANNATGTKGLSGASQQIKKNTKALNQNTVAKKSNTKATINLGKSVKNLFAAFGLIAGAQILANIAKDVFHLTKTFDGLRFAMQKIAGSMEDAATSERFLTRITKDFGVSLITTTNRYIKFLAAAKQSGLTLRTTENIFRSMTKAAAVLGLQTDELKGIYLALEQMLSKGKVTTEELRRQLGERLPGAMGIMAASMNVTIAQLDKMLKKGEVLSAEVLPGFADAVELAYGIKQVKTVDTLVAAQNRLTTAWQQFVRNVFDDSSKLQSAFNSIAKAIGWMTSAFQGLAGARQDAAVGGEDKQTKIIEDAANDRLDATGKWIGGVEVLTKKKLQFEKDIAKQEIILLKAVAQKKGEEAIKIEKDKLDILREGNSAALQDMIAFEKDLTAFKKEKAAEDIDVLQDNFDLAKKIFAEQEQIIKDFEKSRGKVGNFFDQRESKQLNNRLILLNQILGITEGKLSVAKKLLAEDKSVIEETTEAIEGFTIAQNNSADAWAETTKQVKLQLDKLTEGSTAWMLLKKVYDVMILAQKSLKDAAEDTNDELDKQIGSVTNSENAFNKNIKAMIKTQNTLEKGTFLWKLLGAAIEAARIQQDMFNGSSGGDDRTAEFDDFFDAGEEFHNSMIDLGNVLFDAKIAHIDAEIQAEEDKYALLFLLAEGDDEQQRLLAIQEEEDRQKLEAKRRKELKKQAKFNKINAIIQAEINTALAITSALTFAPPASFVMAALAAATGIAQVIKIASAPVPQFAEGGIMGKDGYAVVGDGGRKEVIQNPDGSIQITPDTSTIVGLQKGAKIHKSIDAFNSDMPSSMSEMLHSATLLATVSLNQDAITGYLESQKVMDGKLLDAMLKNTEAIKKQKLRVTNNNQRIDISHDLYRLKNIS